MFIHLSQFIQDIQHGKMSSTLPIKKSLFAHTGKFESNDQEDAQEFLDLFLESIHKEMNKVIQKPIYKELSLNADKFTVQ